MSPAATLFAFAPCGACAGSGRVHAYTCPVSFHEACCPGVPAEERGVRCLCQPRPCRACQESGLEGRE